MANAMTYPAQSDYLDAIMYDLDLVSISDKCTSHSYTGMYEAILAPYFGKNIRLLEIGIYKGGSLALWSQIFAKAEIVGVDIQDIIEPFARNLFENVQVLIQDAYNKPAEGMFDVIIDDGPHTFESFVSCIEVYLPKLNAGGVMVIEDIPARSMADHLAEYVAGYKHQVVDHRHYKGRHDDICLIVWK